jgi:murein DD-endopeptidase MepM/ murein hydrolase activator NlpD
MNKKGASILMMIFEVLVVSMVIYIMISVAHSYSSSLLTAKIDAAEDVNMMINTLVGIPGNAIVKYPRDTSPFTFVIDSGKITVLEKDEVEQAWVRRQFYLPEGYQAQGLVEFKPQLCISKREKRIKISDCSEEEETTIIAPGISTTQGACFPIKEESYKYDNNDFGAQRDGGERCHVGNDLFTKKPGEIVAVADGKVTNIIANWYSCQDGWGLQNEGLSGKQSISAVLVYHPELDITINYGEIDNNKVNVRKGDFVQRGTVLGVASYCGMLHFETYQGERRNTIRWDPSTEVGAGKHYCVDNNLDNRNSAIIDPQLVLSSLKGNFCQKNEIVVG